MAHSYFTKPNRLKTIDQTMELLAQRTQGQSGAVQNPQEAPSVVPSSATALVWMPPERNTDGSGRQFDQTRTYRVTKTIKADTVTYFAWNDHSRKLLGYHPTVEHCRDLCQKHWESTCAISNSSGSCSSAASPHPED